MATASRSLTGRSPSSTSQPDGPGLARRPRERHALATRQRAGEVRRDRGRGVGHVRRRVERDGVRATPLERDRPSEERADRRDERLDAACRHRELREVAPRGRDDWRSSSPRRSTRNPMSRFSSAAGSRPWTRIAGQARVGRGAAEVGERVARLAAGVVPPSPAPGRGAAPRRRCGRASGRGRRGRPGAGATTGSELAGTITRSLGSRTSSAGTRARSTRTQPTVRGAVRLGHRRPDGVARPGAASRGSRGAGPSRESVRYAACARAPARRAGRPGPRRGPSGGDEVVEHAAELARHVDVAIRADGERDAAVPARGGPRPGDAASRT